MAMDFKILIYIRLISLPLQMSMLFVRGKHDRIMREHVDKVRSFEFMHVDKVA